MSICALFLINKIKIKTIHFIKKCEIMENQVIYQVEIPNDESETTEIKISCNKNRFEKFKGIIILIIFCSIIIKLLSSIEFYNDKRLSEFLEIGFIFTFSLIFVFTFKIVETQNIKYMTFFSMFIFMLIMIIFFLISHTIDYFDNEKNMFDECLNFIDENQIIVKETIKNSTFLTYCFENCYYSDKIEKENLKVCYILLSVK